MLNGVELLLKLVLELRAENKENNMCDVDNIASENHVEWHSGVTKYCLSDERTDTVVKWGRYSYTDHVREARLYERAIEWGVEKAFPKTEIIFSTEDFSVVSQEKSLILETYLYNRADYPNIKYPDVRGRDNDEGASLLYNDTQLSHAGYGFCKAISEYYGYDFCVELANFINEYHINDLHDNNVGFLGDRPVLLDFSGYHSNTDDNYSDDYYSSDYYYSTEWDSEEEEEGLFTI